MYDLNRPVGKGSRSGYLVLRDGQEEQDGGGWYKPGAVEG